MSAQSVIRWLAWALTAISFLGSWSHCYERVLAAGQGERLALVIATLPEVSVLVALLAWLSGERSVWVTITGVSAFAFTITANWQTAHAGVWSHTVAVWPAWSAITALMLTHGPAGPENGTERVSDVHARLQVDVSTRAQPDGAAAPRAARSVDLVSAQPLTPALTERSVAQVVSAEERSALTERSQDPQSERSQDQQSEHAVSAPEIHTESYPLIDDKNIDIELPVTTQERIAWLRIQGEMNNDDVMKIFSVSAATARRYRQAAQNKE